MSKGAAFCNKVWRVFCDLRDRKLGNKTTAPIAEPQSRKVRVAFTIGKGASIEEAGAFVDQLYANHFGTVKH